MPTLPTVSLTVILASLLMTCLVTSRGETCVDEQKEKVPAMNSDKPWAVFQLSEVLAQRDKSRPPYFEFLNVPNLRTGIYHLGAAEEDHQSPHREDEVYYVLKGRSKFQVEGKELTAKEGSIIYVKAGAKHYFHSIEEDLTLLVFFSATPSK